MSSSYMKSDEVQKETGLGVLHSIVSQPLQAKLKFIYARHIYRRGLPTAILLVCGVAIWGACNGVGPFQRSDLNESLLQVRANGC